MWIGAAATAGIAYWLRSEGFSLPMVFLYSFQFPISVRIYHLGFSFQIIQPHRFSFYFIFSPIHNSPAFASTIAVTRALVSKYLFAISSECEKNSSNLFQNHVSTRPKKKRKKNQTQISYDIPFSVFGSSESSQSKCIAQSKLLSQYEDLTKTKLSWKAKLALVFNTNTAYLLLKMGMIVWICIIYNLQQI